MAWLGPTLTITAAVLFSASLPAYAAHADGAAARYATLETRMAAVGRPLDPTAGPVISDHPIWLAEVARIPTLALPDEPPSSVVDLARAFPGTRYLVVADDDHGRWPAVLSNGVPDADCFHEVDLAVAPGSADALALDGTRVFEIDCP